jgi:hypothetical protein
VAIILSPLAHQLLVIDSTVDALTVSDMSEDDVALFEKLKDFGSGHRLDIRGDKMSGLYRLTESLGNFEIAKVLFEFEVGCEPLSLSNGVNRMILKRRLGVDGSEEQEFLTLNFFKISIHCWGGSTSQYLISIVRRSSLRLLNEDSLVRVISTLPPDPSRVELLSAVESEFVSVSGIEEYLKLISLDEMNESHWQSICRRLRRDVGPVLSGNRFIQSEIVHKGRQDFEGILYYLKQQHGENIRSAVSIEASSLSYGDPYEVTNYGAKVNWHTGHVSNSWLQFDFKDRSVSISSYSMKSRYDGEFIPRSWVIEGSNEDTGWIELDRRDNDDTIQGGHAFHNFKCPSRDDDHMFRYIRLSQTGLNSSNYNHLLLCNFEPFGRLSSPGSS